MKAMKLALLGTAALAAASVSARADELSDLKAQIESLNGRVATLEATPAMPAGYSMVAFSKQGNDHIISIMPTADAPAASTEIVWSGYVRGAVVAAYNNPNAVVAPNSSYSADVVARAELAVKAKTDTAVGEVGAAIAFQAPTTGSLAYNAGNPTIMTDGYYGWWKMTPNLTLSAGNGNSVQGGGNNLSRNNYSFDAVCECDYTDTWEAVTSSPQAYPAQIALAYADGPLGLAIALEDSNNYNNNSALGASAKATYKSDIVGFDVSGGYWGNTAPGGDASWTIDAGIGATIDSIGIGATIGTGHAGMGSTQNGGLVTNPAANYDYTHASGYAKVGLGDTANLQLGLVHDFSTAAFGTAAAPIDPYAGATLFLAGLYYTPVKQLQLGVEGQYQTGGLNDQSYIADFVTVFKF